MKHLSEAVYYMKFEAPDIAKNRKAGQFLIVMVDQDLNERIPLTIADAKNEILGLVVGDYYKGPKQDLDSNRPGDIWEFKKNIDGMQFYVKVKIVQENGKDILKCLAFHEDDFA